MTRSKVRISDLLSLKGRRPVAALTAYDYPTARLLDEAGLEVLLVGDSLGMVVLGHPDTTQVTMEDMIHHTRAVHRAQPAALVGVDLPYRSYETVDQAVANARRLVEAGADFVKAEGGCAIRPQIEAIIRVGIPFMGHLGMLPQHIREEGGKYRVKGRDDAGRKALLEDVQVLERAGAFACVLELVVPDLADRITRGCPGLLTLGIGSGDACDGQIRVVSDLAGGFPWFTPRFVTPRLRQGEDLREMAAGWRMEIERGPTS